MTLAYRNIFFGLTLGAVVLLGSGRPARSDDRPPLAGTWTWSWKDRDGKTHQHVLEIEGKNEKLAAREQFDDLPPVGVSNLIRKEKKVRFTVLRGDHLAAYSGVVADADTINGTVAVKTKDGGESDEFVWKATRQTQPKLPPQPAPKKPEE